eukprot:TRINITY_DN18408_c0_g2_i3.p2 TRINITY_DN18408_c0_g2~~TRINITY_DN18408_c0_g2_i3.p2  ORF type:complete len:243 (+),score=-19.98 TRINITY_DN18408_c0_g2_i3:61-729(+)
MTPLNNNTNYNTSQTQHLQQKPLPSSIISADLSPQNQSTCHIFSIQHFVSTLSTTDHDHQLQNNPQSVCSGKNLDCNQCSLEPINILNTQKYIQNFKKINSKHIKTKSLVTFSQKFRNQNINFPTPSTQLSTSAKLVLYLQFINKQYFSIYTFSVSICFQDSNQLHPHCNNKVYMQQCIIFLQHIIQVQHIVHKLLGGIYLSLQKQGCKYSKTNNLHIIFQF